MLGCQAQLYTPIGSVMYRIIVFHVQPMLTKHDQRTQTLHLCHICLHWGGLGGQCKHIWQSHGVANTKEESVPGIYDPHPLINVYAMQHGNRILGLFLGVRNAHTSMVST